MKIAFVYDVIYPYVVGGGEKRIWELSKGLTDRGHEVHVFGMKSWEGENIFVKEGIHLHGFFQPRELFVAERRSIGEAIHAGRKIFPCLLKERFDVIDCQASPYFPCFSSRVASFVRREPLVITWYEVWNDYWYEYLGKKGIFGKFVEKAVARLAGTVIAISEQVKDDLIAIGVKAENIKIVPDGMNLIQIQAVEATERVRFDVLYAGRLAEHKNVDTLIRAIAVLRGIIPNIKCGIVGDGPERDRLERLRIELSLQENVELLGFLEKDDDVISTMKASRVFVLPSTREGGGLVTLEANACGLPVITIDHPQNAAKEVVLNEKNGFLCKLSDEELAYAILNGLNSSENMKKDCIDFASRYDWGRMAELTEAVYYDLCKVDKVSHT
ncbi:MAG: glycosyltransferase family 4 protein [Dehalococcoidia bacterium]|nr:glycosyltransferase family 4 protein [Dehalococcoidia bacterium]